MFPNLRALARGAGMAAALLGLSVAFVQQSRPFEVVAQASPAVELTPAELDAARAFPAYTGAIPVINFHDISDRRTAYSTPASTFARQLAILRAAGFHTVHLDQVRDLVQGKRPVLPSRPLLITFDDGVTTQYTQADSSLQRYDFHAVSFVITGLVAKRQPSYYLTNDELAQMVASGRWELGSHTDLGHSMVTGVQGKKTPWLTTRIRQDSGQAEPIAAWRQRVEADFEASAAKLRHYRPAVTAFAYPFSSATLPDDDPALAGQAQAAVARHFELGFTAYTRPAEAIQAGSDPALLPRFEVTRGLTPKALLDAVAQMVPKAPSAVVADWKLRAEEDTTCSQVGHTLGVISSRYGRCVPTVSGRSWSDYVLSTRVTGLKGDATALVSVRDSHEARWEFALSHDEWSLRTLATGSQWKTIAQGAIAPEQVGAEHALGLRVQGDRLWVQLDGKQLGTWGPLASSGWGAPSFGVTSTGGLRQVYFRDMRVA